MRTILLILFTMFSTNCLVFSNNLTNFAMWIGGNCKPSDKGMLTTFPRFFSCQQNVIDVSTMLNFEDLPKVNSERWLSLEDLDGEKWKSIPLYEDKYQISNYGRIKSNSRKFWNGVAYCNFKQRILKLSLNKRCGGYYYVSFHNKSGEASVKFLVHRLVAMAFIDNPLNLSNINHINENSRDNRACNLEWCDISYNNAYGTARTRAQITRLYKGISKPVGKYDHKGNLVASYISLGQASKTLGVHKATLSEYCHKAKPFKDGFLYLFIPPYNDDSKKTYGKS